MHFNNKLTITLLTAFIAVTSVFATIDDPCYDDDGNEGTCVKISQCNLYESQKGDSKIHIEGKNGLPCPNDTENVVCCIKNINVFRNGTEVTSNGVPTEGNCINTAHCNGITVDTWECPGSDNVKLCIPEQSQKTNTTQPSQAIPITQTTKPINIFSLIQKKFNKNKVKEIIDLSRYNEVSDYSKAAKVVDGVIIRAGFRGYGSVGNIVKDQRLDTHYNGFHGKIKIGYYFFSQAINESEAIEEANTLHSFIKDKARPDLPIFWDTEDSGARLSGDTGRADALNKNDRTKCAIAFIKRIRELGYKPGIYASENWYKNNLYYDIIVATGASIWVANYSRKPSIYKYDAWQFSNTETIDGIIGNVDRSHVYGCW